MPLTPKTGTKQDEFRVHLLYIQITDCDLSVHSNSPRSSVSSMSTPAPSPPPPPPPTETQAKTTPPTPVQPVESGQSIDDLFTRVAEKAKSDADTAELLSMLKTQTERVNTQKKDAEKRDKDAEKKEAVYRKSIEESSNALKAKLAQSRLDKRAKEIFEKWIDNGGAEEYLLGGDNPFEQSETTGQEEKQKQPSVQETQSVQAIEPVPSTPVTPIVLATKPRASVEFDPRQLAQMYRDATFTNIKTGVVHPPLEKKSQPIAMPSEAPPTFEQMLRARYNGNSFAEQMFKDPMMSRSLRQLGDPLTIKASGRETMFMTDEQKELYWATMMASCDLAVNCILYGLPTPPPQIGTKRKGMM